jgi:major membrane immunogen (membrane-anchored lipoprotein)|nr:MAG TPA: hypothetical protein [Caudoviricetes sp.]
MRIEIQNEEIIKIVSGGTLSTTEIKSIMKQILDKDTMIKKENETLKKKVDKLIKQGENVACVGETHLIQGGKE